MDCQLSKSSCVSSLDLLCFALEDKLGRTEGIDPRKRERITAVYVNLAAHSSPMKLSPAIAESPSTEWTLTIRCATGVRRLPIEKT